MGGRARNRGVFWGVLFAVIISALLAEAVIPPVGRTLRAIAAVNRASDRTQALQLEMKLRIGDEPPIASAVLISHPSGLARLEIRGFEGRVDRYLLIGNELAATRNGEPVLRPRPVLQPYFLLQPGSEATLRTALEAFGVRTESIGLAPCGDLDCFVIGDPRLEAPLPPPEIDAGNDGLEDLGLDAQSGRSRFRSADKGVEMDANVVEGRLARLWVDVQELQVQRIDRSNGVFVRFGPVASFASIKVPAWYEIHDPDENFPMRFEVERAVHVNAPPKAFNRSWLTAVDSDEKGATD